MKPPVYSILWNTDQESGELPITYISLEAALDAAREWEKEMVADQKAPPNPTTRYRTEVRRIR